MPFIRILGLERDTSQMKLGNLEGAIQNAVSRVKILNVPAEAVYVYYQHDLMRKNRNQLVAMIEGLYIKNERDEDVLEELRNAVCDCLVGYARAYLPECKRTEAFIASMVQKEHCSVRDPTEPWDRCPQCKGSGGKSFTEPCGDCGGTGKVPAK